MKRSSTLLALCLIGSWSAFAQTSTSYSSDTSRTNTTDPSRTGTTSTYTTTPTEPTNTSTSSPYTSGTSNYSSSTTPMSTTSSTSTYSSTTGTSSYDQGYREGRASRPRAEKAYKAFTGGFYVGANTTRYRGEDVDGDNLSGRLGYQAGVFVRGGGRIYGQIGAEYFASSSNYFREGDGSSLQDITERINVKWLQIPVYLGVKLVESDRGISAIRLAVGAEYANRLSSSSSVSVNEAEIKSGAFLGLANLGFDIGPLLIDLVYHHGFSGAVRGFNDSQRRSLGVNVGFKF
ncbi:PorT family protein [Tellurirhabdus bombi]|uniref:PorT family protein n=1 Tax=Tellurirhabdus bombi TaxID=2907205 RepID=UPI001F465F2E|nr:PorT family protein [Tellurirhabdus bombi]